MVLLRLAFVMIASLNSAMLTERSSSVLLKRILRQKQNNSLATELPSSVRSQGTVMIKQGKAFLLN